MLEGSRNFIYLFIFLIQPFLVQYAAIFFVVTQRSFCDPILGRRLRDKMAKHKMAK